MKKPIERIFTTIAKIRKKTLLKIHHLLNQRIQKYKEDYYIVNHKEPEEFEIKRFKKDLMMQYGLMIYLPLIVILFIFWFSAKEGGIFG
ncbi:MAG: hypothetical protein N2A99_04090 [Carnobacterium alterfunditum]